MKRRTATIISPVTEGRFGPNLWRDERGVIAIIAVLLLTVMVGMAATPSSRDAPGSEPGGRSKDMLQHLKTLIRDEEGASAVEYGLLVALIAAVIIVAVTAIGTNLSGKFTEVAGKLK